MYIVCIFYIKLVVYFIIIYNGGTQTKKGKLNIILASMIKETWTTCVKRVVWHYYEPRPEKNTSLLQRKTLTLVVQEIDSEERSRKWIYKWETFYSLPVRLSILSFSAPLFLINFLEPHEQGLFLFEATSCFF